MIKTIKTDITNRPLSAVIMFYIIGIFLAFSFGIGKVFLIVSAMLLFLVFLTIKGIRNKSYNFIIFFFCIASLFLGSFHINRYDTTNQVALKNAIGQKGWIHGTVISSPDISTKGNHYSVIVKVHEIELKDESRPIDGNMRLFVSIRDNSSPSMNEKIMFYSELLKPDFNEGNFDYELYLKTKNIYATGFANVVYPDHNANRSAGISEIFMSGCRNLRESINNQLEKLFRYDADACAVIKGILLGDKTDFSDTLTENFSTSGISHIAAVSGLHLSILFSVLCSLLGFFKIRKKFVSIVILPTVLVFSAVTGFSPSVCRAGIMLTMYLFALMTKRQYDSITALFISAFIILAVNPYSLFDISFILSSVSTFAIIIIYPIIYEKVSPFCKENKLFLYIVSSLAISISVLIGTAPFVAYYFGKVSLFSIIANIWIVALCTPVFVSGYVLCFLSIFLPKILYSLILYPLATLIEVIILTTQFSSKIKFLILSFPSFSPYLMLLYFGILLFIIFKIKSKKAPL